MLAIRFTFPFVNVQFIWLNSELDDKPTKEMPMNQVSLNINTRYGQHKADKPHSSMF